MFKNTLILVASVGGTFAIVAAALTLGSLKGGSLHKTAGRIFALTLLSLAAAMLPLGWWSQDLFPVVLMALSVSCLLIGWRAALNRDGDVGISDWLTMAPLALLGSFMIGLGGVHLLLSVLGRASAVGGTASAFVLFGGLAIVMGVEDVQDFLAPPIRGQRRMARHLTRMVAAVAFAAAALAAAYVPILPLWLRWLLPVLIAAPYAGYHRRKIYRPPDFLRRATPVRAWRGL